MNPAEVEEETPAYESIPENISHNRMQEFRAWQAAQGYETGGAQNVQVIGSASAMERFRQW